MKRLKNFIFINTLISEKIEGIGYNEVDIHCSIKVIPIVLIKVSSLLKQMYKDEY